MSDPVDDQLRAAGRETAALVARMVPGIEASKGPIPEWAERMTAPLFHPTTPRCVHLIERPAQPWFAILYERVWRCRRCMQRHQRELVATSAVHLNTVEDHSCDRCRRYSTSLKVLVLRFDMWIIHAALCTACEAILPDIRRPET